MALPQIEPVLERLCAVPTKTLCPSIGWCDRNGPAVPINGFGMVITPSRIISANSGGNSVTKMIMNLWKDEAGAAAAEYALILAIVGTAIAASAIALGTAVSTAMNNAATCIKTPSSC